MTRENKFSGRSVKTELALVKIIHSNILNITSCGVFILMTISTMHTFLLNGCNVLVSHVKVSRQGNGRTADKFPVVFSTLQQIKYHPQESSDARALRQAWEVV